MDYLEIIFAILGFIGLGTIIGFYKKIRNKYVRKNYQNLVMIIFILLLFLLIISSILLFNKWTNLTQCQTNVSILLTENKGLKNPKQRLEIT